MEEFKSVYTDKGLLRFHSFYDFVIILRFYRIASVLPPKIKKKIRLVGLGTLGAIYCFLWVLLESSEFNAALWSVLSCTIL